MITTVRSRLRAVVRVGPNRKPDDGGLITIIVLGLMVSLIAVVGLVYDAGGALTDRQRAADIAAQAARAGADQVVPDASGQLVIDRAAAQAVAIDWIERAGATGNARATAGEVHVTVTLAHRTQLLALVGKDTLTLTGTAVARPLPGLRIAGGSP